jgi:hypothetical protein
MGSSVSHPFPGNCNAQEDIPMRVLARIAFAFLLLLIVSTTLFGQEFHTLNLTQSLGLPFGSGVSLNNQDVISTLVRIGSIDEVVTVNINGDFTNLTQGQFNFPGQASINNLGQIVFTVDVEPPDDCSVVNCNVIFWNGSSFQNITNGSIPVYPAGVLGRALNDSGLVAIATNQGLALYNGMNLTMLTSGTSITDTGNAPPSINSSGQIAFLGIDFTINRNDIYLFGGSSIITLTNDPALQIGGVGSFPSINDNGHVAFIGDKIGVSNSRLFFYNGTEIIDLTATVGIAHSVLAVSLNNSDQIAFITSPGDLWFFDLKTGIAKQIDSEPGTPPTVQINNRSNIAYIKGQNVMLATLTSGVVNVTIDIIPGSFPNSINPNSNATIPVAILTTDAFNVTTVDPSTVRFGATGTEATRLRFSLEDVNRDRRPDLLLQFRFDTMKEDSNERLVSIYSPSTL